MRDHALVAQLGDLAATVSIVSPRKSAMSARASGRSKTVWPALSASGSHACDQQQEARDPLGRGLAAQRHHPVARLVEFLQRLLEQALFELRRRSTRRSSTILGKGQS